MTMFNGLIDDDIAVDRVIEFVSIERVNLHSCVSFMLVLLWLSEYIDDAYLFTESNVSPHRLNRKHLRSSQRDKLLLFCLNG